MDSRIGADEGDSPHLPRVSQPVQLSEPRGLRHNLPLIYSICLGTASVSGIIYEGSLAIFAQHVALFIAGY